MLTSNQYEDFGKWNELAILDDSYTIVGSTPGHSGDFFPETPEDYFATLNGIGWPVRADIDITNICNHECPFCFSQDDRRKAPSLSMPADLFKRTVDELITNGTISIRFCGGGEPLAHPQAMDLMSYALAHEIHVTLLTNGDLFSHKFQCAFLRPFTYVRFSVNGYDSSTRSLMHGTSMSSYGRLFDNIEKFNAARSGDRLLESTRVGATYLIHPDNYKGLRRVALQLKDLGVDHVAFRQIKGTQFAPHFSTEMENTIRLELDDLKAELENEQFKIFATHRPLTDPGSKPSHYFSTCLVSRTRVIIEADGAVQMCPRARGERTWRTLGIITDNDTFTQIWHSGVREYQQSAAPAQCADCIDISSNATLNAILDRNGRHIIKLDSRV